MSTIETHEFISLKCSERICENFLIKENKCIRSYIVSHYILCCVRFVLMPRLIS